MAETFLTDAVVSREEETLFSRDIDGQLVRIDPVTEADYKTKVNLSIDGHAIPVFKAVPTTDSQGAIIRDAEGRTIPRATTIYDAAKKLFEQRGEPNPIPILCHQEHMAPVAVCRICVVEIARIVRGDKRVERKLLPACQHRVEEGMEVQTIESGNEKSRNRVRASVATLTELLMADHLHGSPDHQQPYNELAGLARRFGLRESRFPRRSSELAERPQDDSSHMIAVDHDACVLCDRCVRACDEVKKNMVIGRTGKGYQTQIGFDLNVPMGDSSCVSCGECMISCPTDALQLRVKKNDSEVKPDHALVPAKETLWSVLSSRIPFRAQSDGGNAKPDIELVPIEEIRLNKLFRNVPYKFLQWNARAIRRRRLHTGDELCREGEPGSTAFLIMSGKYEISIRTAQASIENQSDAKGSLFGRVKTFLSPRSTDRQQEYPTRSIRSDGGAPLALDKPIAVRTPDHVIIGEMTCLSHYPRSATIRALEDGEVWEIDRNVLYMLQRDSGARAILDKAYREHVLSDVLRSLGEFDGLDTDFLRDKIKLVRVDKGQIICRQGEQATEYYIVRLGFVKVSQTFAGGNQRVLNYMGPGAGFGEIGLLSRLIDFSDASGKADFATGVRTAACSALDEVELVQISGDHFLELVNKYPETRARLVERAKVLLQRNHEEQHKLDSGLREFLDQGLYSAQKLLVLDLEACTRCDECTRACADSHQGVSRLIREGLRYDSFLVASSCRSCLDPYCLVGCPVDAIHRRPRKDDPTSLEIVIEDWCVGCGQCARNCPYGNINVQELPNKKSETGYSIKATTCDLCRNVVSANQDPSCVYACPHNAAFRMSGPQFFDIVGSLRKSAQPAEAGSIGAESTS